MRSFTFCPLFSFPLPVLEHLSSLYPDFFLEAFDSICNVFIVATSVFFSASLAFLPADSANFCVVIYSSSFFLFFAAVNSYWSALLFLAFSGYWASLSLSIRYIFYLLFAWLQEVRSSSLIANAAISICFAEIVSWAKCIAFKLSSLWFGARASLFTEKPLSTAAWPWDNVRRNLTVVICLLCVQYIIEESI